MVRAMKSGYLLSLLLVFAGCKTAVSTLPACQTFNNDGGALGTPNLDAGLASIGCFYAPTATASRTACSDGVTSACDSSGAPAPNLACLPLPAADMAGADAGPPDMAAAASLTVVTLTGFVHVFDNGGNGDQVTLSLFNGTQLAMGVDPVSLVPLGSTVLTLRTQPKTGTPVPIDPWLACDRDLSKGCTVPIVSGCAVPCNDGRNSARDDGKYCRDDGKGGVCSDRLRWEASYTQMGVPAGQPLVVRVTGLNSRPDTNWVSVLQWNVRIPVPTDSGVRLCSSHTDSECYDGDPTTTATPTYRLNITAMSQFDYSHLAVVAGLPGGIGFDHGIVLGEVHDCDGVRLQNAEVAVSPRTDRFTYFSTDLFTMTPDLRRDVTDPLGRYAALNQLPGKVSIAAGGAVGAGGPFTLFGTATAFVYANTVSLVNVGNGF
jgi:hypothetical protein